MGWISLLILNFLKTRTIKPFSIKKFVNLPEMTFQKDITLL